MLALLRTIDRTTPGAASTGFLDTHQWVPLTSQPGVTIAGGHPDAQYRRAALSRSQPQLLSFSLRRVDLPDGVHTARLLRRWLYRAGLPDGALGDIIVADSALIIAAPDAGLEHAVPGAVRSDTIELPAVPISRTTAAGPRADAVLTALFKVSRGEAQTAIKYGFVFRNCAPLTKRTTALGAGDQVVYRTKGRAEIVSIETNPRSGRVWVEFRSFPD